MNEERKFTNTLGPAKSGENQLKHESLRRMSMFTNMTSQSKRSNEVNSLDKKNWDSVDFNKKNYDEFRLLTEMVRYERINFLQAVDKSKLFTVTQRDEYSGDNLIHYAVLSGKANFINRVKHMFENEINTKND